MQALENLVALRAHGYRPGRGLGHRMIVFSTLAHTVASPAAEWAALVRYHTKRNSSEYAGLVNASESEARDLIEVTSSLRDRVRAWLSLIDPTFKKSLNDGASPMTACDRLQTRLQTELNTWLIIGVVDSPERINPGDREHRLPGIRKVTSGSTPEAADFVDQFYAGIITAGAYDAIVVAVAHDQFKAMGASALRALGKPQHVLYDLKYALPAAASDLRL